MLLIAVSLFALGAWYFAVGRLETGSLSTRLVLVGCGTCGQIALTCTWLSVCGAATTGALALTSVGLSTVGLALVFSLAPQVETFRARLTGDLAALRRGAAALGWETALLGLLLFFAGAWILGASWLYPPRGVDDLVYHLPPIYQTAQNHRFEILPLELRPHFAFPFTGEMPFLWVILLGGSLRWVDGCQLPLVGLAILVVYSLARRYGVSVRGAALAGGMFGAMPVVLLQSASNYVDFQSCLWVLVAAVAVFRFSESGSRLALVVAGISCGLALGAKYITTIFLLPFAWIVVRRLLAEGRGFGSRVAAAGLFLLPVAAVSGYWYARNWLLWNNPLYPYPISAFGMDLFPGIFMPQGDSTWSKVSSDPAELLRIGLWDPGLGTFDGGFGFLFWGFSVPALFYLTWAIRGEPPLRRLGLGSVIALAPLGLLALFINPHKDLAFTPRYVLLMAAPVFVAMGLLVDRIAVRGLGAATILRALAVVAAVLSLPIMAATDRPYLNLEGAVEDRSETAGSAQPSGPSGPGGLLGPDRPGNLRYLRHGIGSLAGMARIWEPLDEITREGAGLNVYQACEWRIFWTAPTYGTELQNRIWNFETSRGPDPEAFFFCGQAKDLFFVGRTITRAEVAADPRYQLVASEGDGVGALYVSRAALGDKNRASRLAEYYRRTKPDMVAMVRKSAIAMEPGSVVIAPFPIAAGYLVLRADGVMSAELEAVTSAEVLATAERWPDRPLYVVGGLLPGRSGHQVDEFSLRGKKIPLMLINPERAR